VLYVSFPELLSIYRMIFIKCCIIDVVGERGKIFYYFSEGT
jgi:hypothetical protein